MLNTSSPSTKTGHSLTPVSESENNTSSCPANQDTSEREEKQQLVVSSKDDRKEYAGIINNNPIILTTPQPGQSITATSLNALGDASNTVQFLVAFSRDTVSSQVISDFNQSQVSSQGTATTQPASEMSSTLVTTSHSL